MAIRLTRTIRRATLLAAAAAMLGAVVSVPPAHAAPAPTQQAALAANACGGAIAVDLSDFPSLPDDTVQLVLRAGVVQDDSLIKVTLVAGPGINANKAIRSCDGGQLTDDVLVTQEGDTDSMFLELETVDQLTLRKAGFAGIMNNKYVLANSDIDHLGGYELRFTWRQD
jgi:hypothetical protein